MIETEDETQLLFSKKWLSRMKDNIEYYLEESTKKKLSKAVQYYNGFAITDINLVQIKKGR